jgi:NDP-sugar pyrophosphorylase family protein
VFRNDGQWDGSNVIYRDGRIVLYDKHYATRPAADFDYIDYGLIALSRDVVAELVPPLRPGEKADLAPVLHQLSRRGDLAGMEITQRFFEIGSPAGLQDLEQWMRDQS